MSNKEFNFSIWVDFIERDFLDTKFLELLNDGTINGATSNPAIFKNAFSTSSAYKNDIDSYKKAGLSPKAIYEKLAIYDIKKAAKILRPLYDQNNDGFVSIEIDPLLANDSQASIAEGLRLWNEIDEPNVMIKVPATEAGYEVIAELLKNEVNVNATLVFSPKQANDICVAINKAGSFNAKCVISVFVSRFDRLLNDTIPQELRNRVGVYNAAKIYNLISKQNPRNTKTLFASTGVKGNEVPTEYYIIGLIAPNSINTAPIDTIQAYCDSFHNKNPKLPIADEHIKVLFDELEKNDISINETYETLMEDAIKQFEVAFTEILGICK